MVNACLEGAMIEINEMINVKGLPSGLTHSRCTCFPQGREKKETTKLLGYIILSKENRGESCLLVHLFTYYCTGRGDGKEEVWLGEIVH